MMTKSFVRISALLWADILVAYALFVMQNYLTDVWNLSFTHAAEVLNIWGGISMILPVFFLFLVDTILGNFKMLVISSIAYSVGITLVTISTPPVLGTCKKYEFRCVSRAQKVVFYIGMALIAVGVAGNLVSVKPFLKEQETESETHNNNSGGLLDCLKVPASILLVVLPVSGAIAFPYIKPWLLRFLIPAIFTVSAMVLFLSGLCIFPYKKARPQGSPITRVCRVFVAAARKQSQPFPLDARELYVGNETGSQSFSRTRFLKRLEKAAILLQGTDSEEEKRKWRLASVTEVEAAKIAVRMIPMWLTFIICGIVSSFANTYFIEQAKQMNRNLWTKLPLQILLLLYQCFKDYCFTPLALRILRKHQTYGAPIGIAVAMILSILCCVAAATVEIFRLKEIRKHDLLDKPKDPIPMSVFWLLFQFFLLAGLDSFFENSVTAFYNSQSPECMKNYLNFFTNGVKGLGFMCSVLSVYVVGKISESGGRKNWFQFTLNRSHLDRYYWVLACLSGVNLVVFILVASRYTYKDTQAVDMAVANGEPRAILRPRQRLKKSNAAIAFFESCEFHLKLWFKSFY